LMKQVPPHQNISKGGSPPFLKPRQRQVSGKP